MSNENLVLIGDVPCIHCGTPRFPLANRYNELPKRDRVFHLECKLCGTKYTTDKWSVWAHAWSIENSVSFR